MRLAAFAAARKYIRSKGSEHFLGAELKLTTQGGEPLTGFEQWEVDGEMGISEKVGSWWSWERQTAGPRSLPVIQTEITPALIDLMTYG